MERTRSMIEQNGVVYYLEDATTKIIEKYDENLKACVKDVVFNYVKGYEGTVRELDLSWISKQDVIDLKANPGLSKIYLNCTNAKRAALLADSRIICDINVDCNVVVAGSALKRFLSNNINVIEVINFHNVQNQFVKRFLEDMCNKYGINTNFLDYGIVFDSEEAVSKIAA